MPGARQDPLHVAVVGVDLDEQRRPPAELVTAWRDFGRLEAAAAADPSLRVTIVQASWSDDERDVEGIRCHFVREPRPFLRLPTGRVIRRLPRRLYAHVRALAPHVVHVQGLRFPRQLRALKHHLPGVPIVAQDHGLRVPTGWRRWYTRWGLARLDAAMFCTRAQGDALKRVGLLRPQLPIFEVIEMSSPFEPGDQREARAVTELEGDPCLFWLGNLDVNKDPLMILEAAARAAISLPHLRLYMSFRHKDLLQEVRARIDGDPVLAGRVTLLGEIGYPRIQMYLRAADFLVQGSHREAAGVGVIEALACGTTPLVTDIPSFRRITAGGKVGALVPVGSGPDLAREIVAWSARDRRSLRQAARSHFEQELSFQAVGRELREAYQRVGALQ